MAVYGRKIPFPSHHITAACFVFSCFMFARATAKDFQTQARFQRRTQRALWPLGLYLHQAYLEVAFS